ncbi:growth/differentiation factor 8-like [Panonychus citri]|uniref:growth/differentiation factor 8-like n=1 Tax=Panonychus citri TaxID=50023 RepID=UPI0023078B64|nr:growth/differentiation factor 8-like [Panonychus citri]
MKLPHLVNSNHKLFTFTINIIIILSLTSPSVAFILSDNGQQDIRTETTSAQYESSTSTSFSLTSTPPSTTTVSQSVPTPQPPLPLAELQLRLEYIKIKILHKLGLNRAPAIRTTMDHEAYTQLLELRQLHSDPNKNQATRTNHYEMDQMNADDESDKLFLLPIKSGFSSATFNMTLDIDITRYPFRKVTLFTRSSSPPPSSPSPPSSSSTPSTSSSTSSSASSSPLNNSSYETYFEQIKPINNGVSNPLKYTDNTLNDEYEWREYDITKLITKNKWNPLKGQPMIVIDTEPCKLHSALMTIEFNYISATRRRRKVDCSSIKNTSSCCRESFYVNFTQIGWDNWIVQPPGYYANYCKGKCDISHARYHHTTVVQKYSTIINLCCSPREMSNISLIYVNEGGYLFQKNLANMVVESCDCA